MSTEPAEPLIQYQTFENHEEVVGEIDDFVNDFMIDAPNCDAGGFFRVTIEYLKPEE